MAKKEAVTPVSDTMDKNPILKHVYVGNSAKTVPLASEYYINILTSTIQKH
jgi:hypothetical protein